MCCPFPCPCPFLLLLLLLRLLLLLQVTSGFAQFGQYVTVKTGSNYTASAWFRVSAAASNAAVRLGLQGAFSPYPVWGSAGRTLRVADKWQQLMIGGEG